MKKILYFSTSFFLFLSVQAQFNPLAPWMKNLVAERGTQLKIDEQVAAFEAYWETHDKNKKGSGYKPFMRWEYHWRSYMDENGFIQPSNILWQAWRQKQNQRNFRNSQMSLPSSNWEPLGPFAHTNTGSWSSGQGRVNIIHVDPNNPNIIYLGAPAGGIWKSTNNGSTWTPLTDYLPQIGVSGIAIDYSNSNVIYISTGDKDAGDSYSVGVYKSTDGGLTWNPTGFMGSSNPSSSGDILIHPTNNQILWCATNNGIFRTTNAGASWTMVRSGNFSQGNIRLKPGNPDIVYATSNTGFFRSTNGGVSFTQITSALPLSSGRLVMDVTAANPNYVYVLSADSSYEYQGIYRSTDSGLTFTARNTTTDVFESNQAWFDLAIGVSQTDPELVFTGCLNVWNSGNGGSTFTKINNWSNPSSLTYTHADIHYIGYHGSKLFVGSDGGIYVSQNDGTSFTDVTEGAQISQFYKVAVSKQSVSNMVGGLQDNGGHGLSNGIWKNYYGADGMDTAVHPTNPNIYYGFIQNGGGLYISNSAGNGISATVGAPSGQDGNWVTPLVINNAGVVFAGYEDLYRLNGSSWVIQNTTSLGNGNIDYIAIDPSNDAVMYVANGANLYKSTDNGITFINTYTATNSITSIDVHSTNSAIVYMTTQNNSNGVLRSLDGGSTFSNFSNGLPIIGKNIIVHQDRNSDNPVYVGTTLGVYYRDDTLSSWQPFDTNLPNVSVTDLEVNIEDAKLVAATYGRGIWQTSIPVQLANVDVKLVRIKNPDGAINCNAQVVPKVEIKNNGINPLTTISFSYTIDGGTTNTYIWNGNLASLGIIDIEFPAFTLNRGVHTLAVTSNANGDPYLDNNTNAIVFYTNDSGTANVTNTFTSVTDELVTYNPDENVSEWKRGIKTVGMNSAGNAVYSTNLTTTQYLNNKKSYLVSQCYNLSNLVNPKIQFKMRYDLENNWDILYVEYSTDFGASWNVLGQQAPDWYNSDRTPQTTGNDCYNCVGAQWTGTNTTNATYFYPLNMLNTETNVLFRLVFHTDQSVTAQGVSIDDFVITGTLSADSFDMEHVFIYPNPSTLFTVSLGNVIPEKIQVFDVMGKIIYENNLVKITNQQAEINLENASSGIYFVKIQSQSKSTVRRIIKN